MQKKKMTPQEVTSWQQSIKKEEQKENLKKYAILGVFGLIFLAGLGALIKMAGTSSPMSAPVEIPNMPEMRDEDMVLGERNAPVTITEYADFQCPACASYNPVVNRVLEDYKGKVKIVYRHFPLTNVHKNALIAGQAVYASNKQGKFPQMKDMLYENQASWEELQNPRETFATYAQRLGMNVDQFKRDMDSEDARNTVKKSESEAISLGLNSTPTFFIGNMRIQPQGYDDFKTLIDQELSKVN